MTAPLTPLGLRQWLQEGRRETLGCMRAVGLLVLVAAAGCPMVAAGIEVAREGWTTLHRCGLRVWGHAPQAHGGEPLDCLSAACALSARCYWEQQHRATGRHVQQTGEPETDQVETDHGTAAQICSTLSP